MNGNIKSLYKGYWHNRIKGSEDDAGEEEPNEIFDTASFALKGGERILDIGCGDGLFCRHIENKFKKVYGAEISDEAALLSKKRGMFLSVVNANEVLPFKDNTFSAVSGLELIEHLLDPLFAFKEIHRILQPQGQLVLTTPNIRYLRNVYKLIVKGEFPHTSTDTFVWGGGHIHYFTRKDLNHLLQKAGFKQIDFLINQKQFQISKRRKLIRLLTGEKIFGKWFCGSITVSAHKES